MIGQQQDGVRIGPVVLRIAILATFVAGLLLAVRLADLQGVTDYIAFVGVGAFLAARRSRNPIGWLLMLTGWGLAIGSARVAIPAAAIQAGGLTGTDALAVWSSNCGWAFAFVGFVGLTQVFPDGHLPEGRARWLSGSAFVAVVILCAALLASPTIGITTTGGIGVVGPNPFAFPLTTSWTWLLDTSSLYALMFGLVLLGIGALIVRYRRAVGLRRLQYRWLAAAIAAVGVVSVVWVVTFIGLQLDLPFVWILLAIAYPLVPLAIGIAVLRYRLLEIDRIVSRTLAYGALTAILFGVFAAVDLAAHSLLPQILGGGTVGIAVSTLAVAALFNPLRLRLQSLVDRRFNRASYDADQLVIGFSRRLRDGADLPTLVNALADTTRQAVEPQRAGVWIRGTAGGPRGAA